MPRWGALLVLLGVACAPSSPPSAACAKDSTPRDTAPAPSGAAPASTDIAGVALDLPRAGDPDMPRPLPPEPPPGVSNLPPSKTSQDFPPTVMVDITAAGVFWVNGKEVPNPNDFRQLASVEHDHDPNVRVIIRADADVPFKRVILAIDLLKQAGIAKYAFAVSPTPP